MANNTEREMDNNKNIYEEPKGEEKDQTIKRLFFSVLMLLYRESNEQKLGKAKKK
jgi:hypothetical protein